MMKRSFFLSVVIFIFGFSLVVHAAGTESLRTLPIQSAGRVKPFDTFAQESLELIYGKTSFERKPAHEIVMTWLLQPQLWESKPLFEIKYHAVKKALGLANEDKYFSLDSLMKNPKLETLMQELSAKRENKEKLDPYGQAVQRLESQIITFREIASGSLFQIWPDREGPNWKSLKEMTEPEQELFLNVTRAFASALSGDLQASRALDQSVQDFIAAARAVNPETYPSQDRILAEVHHNHFHPFRWAWLAYLLTVISLVLFWVSKSHKFIPASWIFAGVGLCFHIYGFALRIYLTQRAPVANMYESVVWVSFGTVIFAMIIEAVYRWRIVLAAGAAVGSFCLILSDLAPAVLDPSIHPLEPVLRSNFWLTVHVMTITISYAAFFLAFALGDLGLVLYLKDEEKHLEKIKAIVMALYRAMQIGVGFLAPGIILGGVWADYSWGRFWGWDPKETWALIALLGYLAVLHARLAGLIKNFGMVCTAVITFSLVIMAWYGVNYVLGAGLHSYGFGAGGVEYVMGFVSAHLLFVLFVALIRRERLKATS